ncbi:helix-turn-helix domain-containing protein [Ralstonia solanacearum]|uniref:helix-turn-helix domain-containing protein n=1 Tax=Ralstonia solanacearum TaxID=305 RepID=UPI00168AF955|nr:helix-turn-helix transcriptional regulator [Ralstonia solanacearum]QNT25333.1 helix-turn-helix transcriptional regulator [Ralstonia solanacearum]QNT62980.1 helix-turn-helix transcriptional regulator [Ralstonia solanacearum]
MTESANTFADEVGERLRAFRGYLQWSQEKFGEALGGTKRGVQENESGRSAPQAKVLAGLIELGCNVNWLLTGKGPMLLDELVASASSPVDSDLLGLVIGRLEKVIAARGARPAPEKKAEVIALLYDYMMETGKKEGPSVERILRLVA